MQTPRIRRFLGSSTAQDAHAPAGAPTIVDNGTQYSVPNIEYSLSYLMPTGMEDRPKPGNWPYRRFSVISFKSITAAPGFDRHSIESRSGPFLSENLPTGRSPQSRLTYLACPSSSRCGKRIFRGSKGGTVASRAVSPSDTLIRAPASAAGQV